MATAASLDPGRWCHIPYDQNFLYFFWQWEKLFIFKKNSAFLLNSFCQIMMSFSGLCQNLFSAFFRQNIPGIICVYSFYSFYSSFQSLLRQFSWLYSLQNLRIMVTAAVRHLHIHSRRHTGRQIHAGSPVTHYQTLITPFFSENLGQQVGIFTCRKTIYVIIACHDCRRFCFFHRFLKCRQIDFMQCSVINHGIGGHSVSLLIISRKMLQRSAHTMLLHCTNIGRR